MVNILMLLASLHADVAVTQPAPPPAPGKLCVGIDGKTLSDGIYHGDSPPGRPFEAKERDLYSVSNDNQRYVLTVIAGPKKQAGTDVILCLHGRQIIPGSWGGDAGKSIYDITLDRTTADEVAMRLGLKRQDRRRLGEKLEWTFVAKPGKAGSPMPVVFTLKNAGTEPVEFSTGGAYRGSDRDNRFHFEAWLNGNKQPDVGNDQNFGGMSLGVGLAPGESHSQTVNLRNWIALKPGTYKVYCSYDLDLTVPRKNDGTWAHAQEKWDQKAEATIQVVVTP